MSEYYKKYIKYKNKYLNLQTQMGGVLGDELRDEPPPIVRSIPYSYDRDAIDKARELAEAQARIANRDYEDKVGLFKQAIKDKDDFKKDKEIVMSAVTNVGGAIRYADESLKKDKVVALAALNQSKFAGYVFQFLDILFST